ncbi:MAG: hypothetical protein M1814_006741 [Vezdaea aestivalis]|nr:MAG: hypothetical protein M1814_006741 [Vezdaea aestivalis]
MSWAHVPLPRSSTPPLVPPRFEQQNPGPGKYLRRDTDIDVISIPAIGADPKFTWIRYASAPNEEAQSADAQPKGRHDRADRPDWSVGSSTGPRTDVRRPHTGSVVPPTASPDTRRHTIFHPPGSVRFPAEGVDSSRLSSPRSSDERPRSSSVSPQRPSQFRRLSTAAPIAPIDELKLWPKVEPVVEWLGQPLRTDVPRARVAHYRHPVQHEYLLEDYGRSLLRFLLEERTQFSLPDESQRRSTMRPTVFVCHSTGGLVLKKALLLADTLSEKIPACKQLVVDTVGICFFAVPHSGSAVLSDPLCQESVTALLRLRYIDPTDKRSERSIDLPMPEYLYKELSPTNEDLNTLTAQFAPIARSISRIWTFIEARDVRLEVYDSTDRGYHLVKKSRRVVTRPSATLSTSVNPVPNESLEEIPSDHTKLCSFPAGTGLYARNFRIALQHFLSNVVQAQLAQEDVVVKHVPIQIHHFLRTDESLTVSSVAPVPSLADYLEKGPTNLIKESRRRLEKSHGFVRTPAVFIRPPSPDAESTYSKSESAQSKAGDEVLVEPSLLRPQFDSTRIYNERVPLAPPVLTRETSDVFTWTHVPFTCPRWVPDVLNRVMREREDHDVKSSLLRPEFWANRQHRARHTSPHARFLKPTCSIVDRDKSQMVLFMPYLHWDTFRAFQARTKAIKERLLAGDVPPAAKDIEAATSLEKKIIRQYLVGSHPLHCRRTLDQFGFPMLRNTSDRDMDQVLFKRTLPEILTDDRRQETDYAFEVNPHRVRNLQTEDGDRKMLMVDTMWLFVLNKENVVSFFPRKEKSTDRADDLHLESDLHQAIFDETNLDDLPDYTVMDFAALAVKQAVSVLLGEDAQPKVDPTLEVFRIFEEYINFLTESQTASFKAFRDRIEITFRNIRTIKQWQAAGPSNDDEHDFTSLLEFRDVEDELATLAKLFDAQQVVITTMMGHYSPSSFGHKILQDVSITLDGYVAQHHEMADRAKAGRLSAIALLDMKQKQANVDEAVQARIQAQEAAGQSRIILVFTIFTVIFLPLSFFTSLFGMNVREWSGTPTNPTTHDVIVYMCAISFSVIIVAFLLAFVKSVREVVRETTFSLPLILSDFCLVVLKKLYLYGMLHSAFSKTRKLVQRVWHRLAPDRPGVGRTRANGGTLQPDANSVPDGLRAVFQGLSKPVDSDLESGAPPFGSDGAGSSWEWFRWDKSRKVREAFEGGKGGFEKSH